MMSKKMATSSISTYLWGIAALGVSIFALVCNRAAIVVGASTGALILAAMVGTLIGWGGALLGSAICRVARPDMIFTSGGALSLLWHRLFWRCGPQLIGLVGGVILGCALVLH